MSIKNFIPTLWSAEYMKVNANEEILAKLCDRRFEGEIKQFGDTVKINSIIRPTLVDFVPGTTTLTPQSLKGGQQELRITQSKAFAVAVDDLDKVQAKGDLMSEYITECSRETIDAKEEFIASLYSQSAYSQVDASGATRKTLPFLITSAKKNLYTASVPKGTDFHLVVSPGFMEKLENAHIEWGTPNDGVLTKGYQGMASGCYVHMSNNLYNDGTYDYCLLMTKRAIALAHQFADMKAGYLPLTRQDTMTGLDLYGAKVVRPEELVVLKFSAGAETFS